MEESSVVEFAKQRDQEAFLRLVEPLERRLYNIGLCMVGSIHDAEDLWQNTVLLAWRYYPTLRSPDSFRSWMTRILLNQARTMLRKRSRRVVQTNLVQEVAEPVPGPLEYEEVHSCLRKLPLEQREAVLLRFWLDMQLGDIATTTRVPLNTAKTRLYRGMGALKKMLKEGANWRE